MYTAAEMQMLRNAAPGAVLPGIDTTVGNPLPTASLPYYTSLPTTGSGPLVYNPQYNDVLVTQAGAVISGINFGSTELVICAPNVTIKDCTFTASSASNYYAVEQQTGVSGATVENCSFSGPATALNIKQVTMIGGGSGSMNVLNNSFINVPGSAVHVSAGVVSGNYFSGGGYVPGNHCDAIVVDAGNGVSITNNFIDWTSNADAAAGLADPIRVEADSGNCSNVSVSGNYILGGVWSADMGNQATSGHTFSNLSFTNNYIGFCQYYDTPYAGPSVTVSGNTYFDYSNPTFSASAWAAYQAAVLSTPNFVASTGSNISAFSMSGPTTLYGAGHDVYLSGSNKYENNFVGGAGTQYLTGGAGANVFTYLSIGDSTPLAYGTDIINNFDPAKDVIDLSHIDADITTAGLQNFTFIGTAAFSGPGAQVRYYQDAANNCTWVEADLAGDSGRVMCPGTELPDLRIKVYGLQTLTAANFALTPTQSSADMAAGASLGLASGAAVGGVTTYTYSNVQGKNYTSFQALYTNQYTRAADVLNLNTRAGELDLWGANLTISRGSGVESLAAPGASGRSFAYHANETIQAGAAGSETFAFGPNFGAETINAFIASGTKADSIKFATSSFSYLTGSMTQAQDLAAVLAHATSSGSSTTIPDSAGDQLSLNGMTSAMITASGSQFHFA